VSGLQIYDARERWLVRAADAALAPLAWRRRRPAVDRPRRILLLRLERIGDLLMALGAIRAARQAWPDAEIDLVVGSWNLPIAGLIRDVTRVETLDAPWLARGAGGLSWPALLGRARTWRGRYDLAINFEPDIRSNLLVWLSGAAARVGYWTGGGGALLTDAGAFDPASHVDVNARRLIARAAGAAAGDGGAAPETGAAASLLPLPEAAQRRAEAVLAGAARPIIGVHASGGRESKQWHLDRFAAAARALVAAHGGTVLLTGSASDRPLVDVVRAALGSTPCLDAAGALDLVDLAAVLACVDVFITSDTGPMHLAAAAGAPVVALFGPSHPARYGPLARTQRVLRVDLPCSPCGQVRLPPPRCRGHVPDCMDGIQVNAVVRAATELLLDRRATERL
jgi:lipopolysaccharide heptosyltransferase II